MFDVNTLITKQDHKLNLLRQIKLSIESLMFDSGSSANYRSSWQNFGIINTLSRHIFAILEDGLILTESTSSSPNAEGGGGGAAAASSFTQKSSRSATLLSMGMFEEYSASQKEIIIEAVWSFITNMFNFEKLEYDELEKSARKDFEIILSQIKQESTAETTETNYALSWIMISLRQSIFLNQLAYLVRDSPML